MGKLQSTKLTYYETDVKQASLKIPVEVKMKKFGRQTNIKLNVNYKSINVL